MDWLKALDEGAFRFANDTLSNRLFDVLMPFLSGNAFFVPLLILTGAFIIWRGRVKGLLFVLLLALAVGFTDGVVCNSLKKGIGRPRPWAALENVHRLVGRGGSGSMPSSHAANWFAAAAVAFLFHRRSLRVMLPMAVAVSFSRVYNGVHYPSDVIAGGILGGGSGFAVVLGIESLWRKLGAKWFPVWHARLPSLLANPVQQQSTISGSSDCARLAGLQWLRLGYVMIAVLTLLRWAYIGGGIIELSGDEAYQWVWSKHLALSYYSKPLLIAVTHFVGTALWGDTVFAVRFFPPLFAAVVGVLLLRFFAREVNARAGFLLLCVMTLTPLVFLGSVMMTVDVLAVLFWVAAMMSGWRAIQPDAGTAFWLWTGLWMGLGFLSKYTSPLQWLCWAVLFVLWPEARQHLRRPGPYLALGINLICTLPVIIWNQQNGWISFKHVAKHGGLDEAWKPTLRYLGEFLGAEWGLMNPVFFVGMVMALFGMWRRYRRDLRIIYFFSMGAPVFFLYLVLSIKSRVIPNWIAPCVLPLLCMTVVYWDARQREGARQVNVWFLSGLVIGALMIALMLDTNIVAKLVGRPLPAQIDPLTRVRGYEAMARVVEEARSRLAGEGRETFVIGNHYSTTSLMTFYYGEAKKRVGKDPVVFCRPTAMPQSQYYFWPGYSPARAGQNAIFVQDLTSAKLPKDWFARWRRGEKDLRFERDENPPVPEWLSAQFESVTNLGPREVLYKNRVIHTVQIIECRNLR